MNHFIRKLIVVGYSICLPAIALLYLGGCTSKARVDANIEQKSAHSQISSQVKQKLVEKAEAITVKIYAGDNTGSGILLKHQEKTYTVVTNRHVIAHEKSYLIQTPDGVKHQATLLNSSTNEDLALLQFESDRSYTVAEIGNASEQYDRELFASGFPYNSDKLQLSTGKFALQLDTPLKDGYQIGYTNDIQSGMSGGAILDANGKVIGVNARSANPVVPDYQFTDGTRPSEQQEKQLSQLSWGIPIYKVAELAPKLALIPPSSKPLTSQAELFEFDPNTLTEAANDVYQIAQKITVRIDSERGNGSGVIVAKQDNTYYVLTASHVVDNQNKKYYVVTVDGVKHSVEPNTVSSLPGVDLAVVRFTSTKDYDVATLSTYQSNKKLPTFLYGWARFDNQPKATFSSGYLQPKDFNFGSIKDSLSAINGNNLVYTNFSYGGMSGGPLLDSEGRVIGINTAVESERDDLDRFYMGYSLGISTTTVNALLEKLDLKRQWLNLTNSQPKVISAQDVESLYKNNKYLINPEVEKVNLDYQGWMNYGNLLWRTSNYEKAVEAFDKAILLKEDSYQAYYAKGLVLRNLNRYSEAGDVSLKAFEINYNYFPALKQLVSLFVPVDIDRLDYSGEDIKVLKESTSSALKIIDFALKDNFDSEYLHYAKFSILYHTYQNDQAMMSIDKAIQLSPKNYYFYMRRGIFYGEQKQYKLAIKDLNKAVSLSPNIPTIHFALGNIYKKLEKYNLAIEYYTRAIELDPAYANAYFSRSESYAALNKIQLAIEDLDKLIDLKPNDKGLYILRGAGYQEIGNYKSAIKDFTYAIKLNNNDSNVYSHRGQTYYEIKEYELAIKDYTYAIKLNSDNEDVYFNRGIAFNILGKYQQAVRDFSWVIEHNNNAYDAYYNRGLSFSGLEKHEIAIEDFNRTLELNPNYIEAYTQRGISYFMLDQQQQSLNNFEIAARLYKSKGNTNKYLEVQEMIKSIK